MADNPAIKGTLDGFLVAVLGVKRSVIKGAIKAGRVSVNGIVETVRQRELECGDVISGRAGKGEDSTVAIDLVFTGEPVMDEATGEQKWPPASALTVALPTTSPMDQAEGELPMVSPMAVTPAIRFGSRLHQAVGVGDIRLVRQAILQGQLASDAELSFNINEADMWGSTPLMTACKRGAHEVVAYLLGHGADVNKQDVHLQTALSICVKRLNNVSWIETARATGLSHRAVLKDLEIARLLLAVPGLNGSTRVNASGDTVLHLVATGTNVALARMITYTDAFRVKEVVELVNGAGMTASEVGGHSEVGAVLEEHHLEYCPPSAWSDMPMFGGVDSDDEDHESPGWLDELSAAADATPEGGHLIERLIRDPTNGPARIVVVLAQHGLTATYGPTLETAVSACARLNAVPMLSVCLAAGADPTIKDGLGFCPLSRAVAGGHFQATALLLSNVAVQRSVAAGEDANNNGNTALHVAARIGDFGMLRMLTSFDAVRDFTRRNNQRQTPPDMGALVEVDGVMSSPVRAFFEDLLNEDAFLLNTPVAVLPTPTSSVVCSVCLLPPAAPSRDDPEPYWTCPCDTSYCNDCLGRLAEISIREGKIPCCAANCKTSVPFERLSMLPIRIRLELISLESGSAELEETSTHYNCTVCNRPIELTDFALDLRQECPHCAVYYCLVCRLPFPNSDARDELIHKKCDETSNLYKLAAQFEYNLNFVALRRCPKCNTSGIKDEFCTHIACPTTDCNQGWCYCCGIAWAHGQNSLEFMEDTNMCPMYMSLLAHVDPRIAALGCADPQCRPNGVCTSGTCKTLRDNRANSLFSEMRARIYVLRAAEAWGMVKFRNFCRDFGWADILNAQYFNHSFDWDATEVPHWTSFDPPECQEFYRAREHWFDHDIPAVEDAIKVKTNAEMGLTEDGNISPEDMVAILAAQAELDALSDDDMGFDLFG